jgi:hypothetical protein
VYSRLSCLGVVSETTALIAYLVDGYVDGLKQRVPDSVNLYSSAVYKRIIVDGVNAAISIAAGSSSNQVLPRDLLSELKRRFQNRYPTGDPYVDSFNYAVQSYNERQNAIRHLNLIVAAVQLLTPELLAKWVPPTQASGTGTTATVNVDTAAAQATVNQNAAASGLVTTEKSFLENYGMYIAAAALLLLLVFDKGK